ncbi:MAG: 4-hydroxy-tetrahydrodipicolinate reductase [Flavobacteriales bacterium]|nr:4-hydroxy-tetrahydrodipicolinate reductase [Flavobacteriales bacterium]
MNTVFVNGLSGKMGKTINRLILDDPDFEIVKTVSNSDVVIDFSRPESTMPLVQEVKEHKKPLIIGTTGFTDIELKLIEEASNEIPIMLSYNMSKGIYYFKKNIKQFLKDNLESMKCLISETHHTQKVDAPSGTAIELKKFIELNNNKKYITSVEIESKRILDVFGMHEVTFFNDTNHISFKHEALSRKIFADGAISIAKLMTSMSPGMYTTQDFFK